MRGNFTLSLRTILQIATETLSFLYSTVFLKFPTTALNVCSQLIPPQPFVGEDDTESKIKMFFRAYWWQVFCTESMSFSSCFQYEAIYSMMIWKMMTYGKMTLQERTINRMFIHSGEVRMIWHTGCRVVWMSSFHTQHFCASLHYTLILTRALTEVTLIYKNWV